MNENNEAPRRKAERRPHVRGPGEVSRSPGGGDGPSGDVSGLREKRADRAVLAPWICVASLGD